MATSTLDPDHSPERDRQLGRGHGTSALGPSDSSDTGSDVQGGVAWAPDTELGLDRGTNEDSDSGRRDMSAGPDSGDAGLDSDTDSRGTGERATAGRDSDIDMGRDIDTDHIETIGPDGEPDVEPDVERSEHPQSAPRRPRGANPAQ